MREKVTEKPLQDVREHTAGKGLWSGPQVQKKGVVQMPHMMPPFLGEEGSQARKGV